MRPSDLGKQAISQIKVIIGIDDDHLRPTSLDQYVGQADSVAMIKMMADAAKLRGEVMPHTLFEGPPGLGKTSLALAVATHMGGTFFATTGQSVGLETLGKRLSSHRSGSVLFIDECHTLSRSAEVMLLGAIEDRMVDLTTPVGPERRSVQAFTLLGATTEPGSLSRAFKDRFGHTVQLTFYSLDDMIKIVQGSAERLSLEMADSGTEDVAERSHGVPRVANGYIQRLADYALVNGVQVVDRKITDAAFEFMGIDDMGFDARTREYIVTLHDRFSGGPVGIENMAMALGVDNRTIGNDIEPLLLRLGMIARAARGRLLRSSGREYARELLGDL